MQYNFHTYKGKKTIILKTNKGTPFRVPLALLDTDYLEELVEDFIKNATENPDLVEGITVTSRLAFRKRLTRENFTNSRRLKYFIEQELSEEAFRLLQDYIGRHIVERHGAYSLDLQVRRDIAYENYFKGKSAKMGELNKHGNWTIGGEKIERHKDRTGGRWVLRHAKDILDGLCTFGHRIRYAFEVENEFGERIVFGSTCVQDFFDIDDQLRTQINTFVQDIQDLNDEYYNDLHAYYQVHQKLDQLQYVLASYFNRINLGVVYDETDLHYVGEFIKHGIPIPRPLGEKVGMWNLEAFERFKSKYSIDSPFEYFLTFLRGSSHGAHGFEERHIDQYYLTNHLGDRVTKKLIDHYNKVKKHTKGRVPPVNLQDLYEFATGVDIKTVVTYLNNLTKYAVVNIQHPKNERLTVDKKRLHIEHSTHSILALKDDNLLGQWLDMTALQTNQWVFDLELKSYGMTSRKHSTIFFTEQDFQFPFSEQVFTKEWGYIGSVDWDLKDSTFLTENSDNEKVKELDYILKRVFKQEGVVKRVLTILLESKTVQEDPNKLAKVESLVKQYLTKSDLDFITRRQTLMKEIDELYETIKDKCREYEKQPSREYDARNLISEARRDYENSNPSYKALQKKKEDLETHLTKVTNLLENPNPYDELYERAQRVRVYAARRYGFHFDILDTVRKTGRASEKQLRFINELEKEVARLEEVWKDDLK